MQTHHQDEPPHERPELAVLSGFSPYDDDPDIRGLFAYYTFERILQCVKKMYPRLQEADVQDIAAEVQISLWAKLQEEEIYHPKTYIAQMIRHKYIDHWRKNQRHAHASIQILSLSEVQETLENEVVIAPGEGMADPAKEFERKEAISELLTTLVEALLDLPPRQQQSMFCFLLKKLDDPCQFIEICRARNFDISRIRCSANKADKQLLNASRYPARQFLARRFGIDLLPQKRRRRSQATRPRTPSRSRSSRNVSSVSPVLVRHFP